MNSGPIVPSKAALNLLSAHFPNSCMVPNLREISWLGVSPELLELTLPLVVSPVLTNFRLGINCRHHDTIDASQLVPALKALAPAYNSLALIEFCDPTAHDPRVVDAASTLLLKCNPDKLRYFRVRSTLSEEAFLYAAQLPTLEVFFATMDATGLGAPLPTSMFPSLESLDVQATDARPPLLQTIAHIQSKAFSHLQLDFPAAILGTFLPKTLECLQRRSLHQTLSTLTIYPEGRFDLDKAFVRPLLFLKELSILDIGLICTPPCPYLLSDEDLDELVKALPKLSSLNFGHFPCSHPANTTIKTLVSIAKHCKHLTEFVIHTNVEAIANEVSQRENWGDDLAPQDPFSPFVGCPVRKIIFGPCFIPDEQSAQIFAMVLLRLFPHLDAIMPSRDEVQLFWPTVNRLITTYRSVGATIADVGKFMSSLPVCETHFHAAADGVGG